jgi:hypothetical protein
MEKWIHEYLEERWLCPAESLFLDMSEEAEVKHVELQAG